LVIFDPKAPLKRSQSLVRYIKALPLRKFDDVTKMKEELRSGNMLILRLELAFINSKKD